MDLNEEELALLEALDTPEEEGVYLIVKVNPETQEVQSVEDLE
jgi:hypothetical protein